MHSAPPMESIESIPLPSIPKPPEATPPSAAMAARPRPPWPLPGSGCHAWTVRILAPRRPRSARPWTGAAGWPSPGGSWHFCRRLPCSPVGRRGVVGRSLWPPSLHLLSLVLGFCWCENFTGGAELKGAMAGPRQTATLCLCHLFSSRILGLL